MKLLSIGKDVKTTKGQKLGYMTGIAYLAPANESGVMNTCPHASAGCKAACLYTAGFAGMYKAVNEGRVARTLYFHSDRPAFLNTLIGEIHSLIRKAAKHNMVPVVRLNGTSDIPWESIKVDGKNIMEIFPDIQFYDYTKNLARMLNYIKGTLPANYQLTFSKSENNNAKCEIVLAAGGNVAIVFRGGLPKTFWGKKVIDGDISDLRFKDAKNVIVGLKAKGKARKNDSGFVIDVLPDGSVKDAINYLTLAA